MNFPKSDKNYFTSTNLILQIFLAQKDSILPKTSQSREYVSDNMPAAFGQFCIKKLYPKHI